MLHFATTAILTTSDWSHSAGTNHAYCVFPSEDEPVDINVDMFREGPRISNMRSVKHVKFEGTLMPEFDIPPHENPMVLKDKRWRHYESMNHYYSYVEDITGKYADYLGEYKTAWLVLFCYGSWWRDWDPGKITYPTKGWVVDARVLYRSLGKTYRVNITPSDVSCTIVADGQLEYTLPDDISHYRVECSPADQGELITGGNVPPEEYLRIYFSDFAPRNAKSLCSNEIFSDLMNTCMDDSIRLQSNNIANLQNMGELVDTIIHPYKFLCNLVGSGSLKDLGNMWLTYRYMYTTTLLDAQEAKAFWWDQGGLYTAFSTSQQKLRAKASSELLDDFNLTLVINDDTYDDLGLQTAKLMDQIGLFPSYHNLWDMIPFSFMVDWFVGVDNFVSAYDNYCRFNSLYSTEVISLSCKGKRTFSTPWGDVNMSFYLRDVARTLTELGLIYSPTYVDVSGSGGKLKTKLFRLTDAASIFGGMLF